MSGKGLTNYKLLVLCIIPWLLITACAWQASPELPEFELSIFINRIFDAFLQIVVIAFGFLLLDVWWKRKEERKKALPFEEYLLSQVEYIGRLAHESRQKIESMHTEENPEWVEQRDEIIRQNIRRLEIISKTVSYILGENRSISVSTTKGFAYFLSTIAPIIQELSECSKREIQAQIAVFKELLSNLGQKAEETGNYLREDKNDSS
ncbi:MAG: hypothetical protein FD146_418 [Anaerolineaceae bacterium]|nr:MAG: hypothetical protein FD146_418 [Anaerolineaceae bacterium]